jgi:hypothetical protein
MWLVLVNPLHVRSYTTRRMFHQDGYAIIRHRNGCKDSNKNDPKERDGLISLNVGARLIIWTW